MPELHTHLGISTQRKFVLHLGAGEGFVRGISTTTLLDVGVFVRPDLLGVLVTDDFLDSPTNSTSDSFLTGCAERVERAGLRTGVPCCDRNARADLRMPEAAGAGVDPEAADAGVKSLSSSSASRFLVPRCERTGPGERSRMLSMLSASWLPSLSWSTRSTY